MKFLLITFLLFISFFIFFLGLIHADSGSFKDRLDDLTDIRLSMTFSGYKDANLEIFKKEILEGKKGKPEDIIKILEATEPEVKEFIGRQNDRQDSQRAARKRISEIDLEQIKDPVLRDTILILRGH